MSLKQAGLDRVNVSLDTVRPDTFHTITRRDRFHDVVEGLVAARDAGLVPVKINAVLLRGINDDQAPELLRWSIEHGYDLRFIEQMPLDAQHGWSRTEMVTAEEIFAHLEQEFVLTPVDEPRGSAPAELFHVDGGPATVGVIASVTRPFCGDCDRVRLTADGQVRNCLFAREESDLRAALRARHRRPDLPPARPSDVGHRGLALVRAILHRHDVLEELPGGQEVAQRLTVLVTRQPGLAALGRVQLGVVPEDRPDRGRRTAPGRAGQRFVHACIVPNGEPANEWCRTATGEAVRHQARELRRGRLNSPGRLLQKQLLCQRGLARRVELRMGRGSRPQREVVALAVRGVGHHHRDVGQQQCCRDQDPAHPSGTDEDGRDEADRADGHGDDVASLTSGDLFLAARRGGRDPDRVPVTVLVPGHAPHRTSLRSKP
jgi:hypothetical protein